MSNFSSFVPDRDLMTMMDHVVAVWKDWNASGLQSSPEGVPQPNWMPVPGLEAVPCHKSRSNENIQADVGASGGERISEVGEVFIFATPIVVDESYMLVWNDPYRPGVTWYYYVEDDSHSPGGRLANNGQELYFKVTTKRGTTTAPVMG